MSKSLVGLVALIALTPINYDHELYKPGKLVPVRPKDADQLLDVNAAREATDAEIEAYLAEPVTGNRKPTNTGENTEGGSAAGGGAGEGGGSDQGAAGSGNADQGGDTQGAGTRSDTAAATTAAATTSKTAKPAANATGKAKK